MNAAHLHLVVNHLPTMGMFLAIPLILLAMWRRHEVGVTYAACLLLVVGGAGGVIAEETGEGAEEAVETSPTVSEVAIHEHEERAEIAVPIGVVTGLMALGVAAWTAKRGAASAPALGVLLAANLASAAAMAAVAQVGGVINHPEIRDDQLNAGFLTSARDVDAREKHEEAQKR